MSWEASRALYFFFGKVSVGESWVSLLIMSATNPGIEMCILSTSGLSIGPHLPSESRGQDTKSLHGVLKRHGRVEGVVPVACSRACVFPFLCSKLFDE